MNLIIEKRNLSKFKAFLYNQDSKQGTKLMIFLNMQSKVLLIEPLIQELTRTVMKKNDFKNHVLCSFLGIFAIHELSASRRKEEDQDS